MIRRWWGTGLAAGLYLALAVYTTWPLALSLTSTIPSGFEPAFTVPLFNLWTVWWNADQVANGWSGYWDAPIFHPTPGAFVFSEAQPTTAVVAPLAWWISPALAYNVYLLATLTLNGVLARFLWQRVGCGPWSAIVGGLLVVQLPFVIWQLGVLQLTVLWPALWTIRATIDFSEHGGWRWATELGVAFGVTYLTCNYYGLFLAVLLVPSGLWLMRRRWGTGRWLLQLLTAAVIAGTLMAPVVLKQRAASRVHGWTRTDDMLRTLSAERRDIIETPWPQWIDSEPVHPQHMPLGSGWIKLVAAFTGLIAGLCWSSTRRFALLWGTLGFAALMLAFGPALEFRSWSLYGLLREIIPGFAQIRSPFRFVVFWQFGIVALSVFALELLRPSRWTTDAVSARVRWLLAMLSAVLGLAMIGEVQPTRAGMLSLSVLEQPPEWVVFLRDETPPDSPVICLPFVRGGDVQDYASATWWMAWSMQHRRPLLNGYSGYFPQTYITLQNELMEFPDRPVPSLAALGARFAVVDRRAWTEAQLARSAATQEWTWRFSDEVALIDIYELTTTGPSR